MTGFIKTTRVQLTEEIGVEPTPNILIDAQQNTPLPHTLTLSIEELVDRVVQSRGRTSRRKTLSCRNGPDLSFLIAIQIYRLGRTIGLERSKDATTDIRA